MVELVTITVEARHNQPEVHILLQELILNQVEAIHQHHNRIEVQYLQVDPLHHNQIDHLQEVEAVEVIINNVDKNRQVHHDKDNGEDFS